MSDKDGWRRGAKGIDGHETVKLDRKTDYNARGCSPGSFGEPMKGSNQMLGADLKTWAPSSIREGKDTNRAKGKGFSLDQVEAASASGKFASKGIGKYIAK